MYTTPHIFGDLDTEVNLRTCLQLQLDIMYTANSASIASFSGSACMQLQTGRHLVKICRTNRLRFAYFQPTTHSMLGV